MDLPGWREGWGPPLLIGAAAGFMIRSVLLERETHPPSPPATLPRVAEQPPRGSAATPTTGELSSRGAGLVSDGHMPDYIFEHIMRLGDPEYTCLAIAENKVSWDLFHPLLLAAQAAIGRGAARGAAGYDNPSGSAGVRQAVAGFLHREVFRLPATAPATDPDSLCLGAGLSAIFHAVFYSLCEPGDGCLLAAPTYAGFASGLRDPRVAVVPCPVGPSGDDIDSALSARVLDLALAAAAARGVRCRVLLIASPNNPFGRLYRDATIIAAIGWARRHGIHTVVDEVYGCSVFGEGRQHHSAVALLHGDLRHDVHIMCACALLALPRSSHARFRRGGGGSGEEGNHSHAV